MTGSTKDYYDISSGMAYLFSKELNGKRHKGSKDEIIEKNGRNKVEVYTIDLQNYEPLSSLKIGFKNRKGIRV